MPRAVSCRRCGKPGLKALCDKCHSETYGSTEYRRHSALIRHNVTVAMVTGQPVVCIICGQRITVASQVTIEHEVPVGRGGASTLGNLGPAHAECNYAKRSKF